MTHLLHAHNEEMKKVSDTLWNANGTLTHNQIDDLLHTSHKSLYKKLLRKEMWEYYKTACRFGNIHDIPPNALLFLQGNINRLTAELSDLDKDTN